MFDYAHVRLARDIKPAVLTKLDQFIFSEDTRLVDATDSFAGLAVVGPEAARVLGRTVSGVDDGALAARFVAHLVQVLSDLRRVVL